MPCVNIFVLTYSFLQRQPTDAHYCSTANIARACARVEASDHTRLPVVFEILCSSIPSKLAYRGVHPLSLLRRWPDLVLCYCHQLPITTQHVSPLLSSSLPPPSPIAIVALLSIVFFAGNLDTTSGVAGNGVAGNGVADADADADVSAACGGTRQRVSGKDALPCAHCF